MSQKDHAQDEHGDQVDPVDTQENKGVDQASSEGGKEPKAEPNKTEDEITAGPAERSDPGNESPATTAAVE